MAETWLTYRELAQALDISPEAARQKAIRGHWRRQRGNDGKARILVDVDAEKSVHTPRRRTDKHLNEHPDERRPRWQKKCAPSSTPIARGDGGDA